VPNYYDNDDDDDDDEMFKTSHIRENFLLNEHFLRLENAVLYQFFVFVVKYKLSQLVQNAQNFMQY
jgi:hypothetical protein